MAEVFFYHLEGNVAEDVLPDLLQRGLARGLKLAVEVPDKERLSAFSQKLWALEDVAFLAHGIAGEPYPERQKIWLATEDDNPNSATFRFYFGGAWPTGDASYERVSLMFDGGNEIELQTARQLWRDFKAQGLVIKYWKKDEGGRWTDMALPRETAPAGSEN